MSCAGNPRSTLPFPAVFCAHSHVFGRNISLDGIPVGSMMRPACSRLFARSRLQAALKGLPCPCPNKHRVRPLSHQRFLLSYFGHIVHAVQLAVSVGDTASQRHQRQSRRAPRAPPRPQAALLQLPTAKHKNGAKRAPMYARLGDDDRYLTGASAGGQSCVCRHFLSDNL